MTDNEKTQDKEELSEYGKFDSARSLLSAYNALESEFTKRCQLVKELQAELSSHGGAQADGKTTADTQISDNSLDGGKSGEYCACDDPPDARGDKGQALSDRDRDVGDICALAAEYAELLSAVPQIMDACIERYKRKLIGFGNSAAICTGAAVITPVHKPKTLDDAKRLADKLLDR